MNRINIILLSCLGAAFILLHVCAIFLPVEYFWGLDQWRYFPAPITVLFILVGAVICASPLLGKSGFPKVKINIFSNRIFFLLIPVISFSFFWFVRQKIFFLGDGYFWIRMLENGIRYRALEPLEVFIHSVFYESTTKFINISPQDSWALLSAMAGVLFVFVAMRLSDYLGSTYRDKMMIFLSMLSMGTIQLFYGYVETYSIAALLTLIFIYLAVKSFEKRSFAYVSFFVFSLAVCSHISVLGFLPASIYLYFRHLFQFSTLLSKMRFTLGIIISFIFPIAIMLLTFSAGGFTLAKFLNEYSSSGHILPLVPGILAPNVAYTLFSYKHFIDIWNELILIAPISFFAVFLVMFRFNDIKIIILEHKITYLLVAAVSSLILCFLFNMEIGVSRDWDLFSTLALPITIASVLILIGLFKERAHVAGVVILGCCLIHTIPWVVLNAKEDYSLKRYIRLTSSSTWSRHAKSYAYDELRYFYEEKNDLLAALDWAEKAYSQLGNERYRLNLAASYNNVAIMFAEQKQMLEAESYFLRSLQHDPDDFQTIRNVALLYFEKKEYDQALEYFEKVLILHPNDIESLRESARICYILGMYDKADGYLKRALQVNKDKEIERQLLIFQNQLWNKMKN
ncbi:MAG: tetratricopeptide repeat protein [Candidatus Latescibacteria bacterium]|nr:tetratricopeptide repeat protein [Candidatus Latescibacterota bacterium]NIM22187.1 tetratricopeptide repeat protein [Candidatus Latescibacterota bacterium]NIM64737.1 tetratricopeptide repeat protein [Candidatus Latescibacterota bacterium]NIO01247.1 tetratricopeptide repeat protein [Candidatus Latescibacterota bacterium]NIO27632.1 tetratricopeptide repeat protein [Candidatus Latescibacterota bacterium]